MPRLSCRQIRRMAKVIRLSISQAKITNLKPIWVWAVSMTRVICSFNLSKRRDRMTSKQHTKLPNFLIWTIVAICVCPFLLNQLGINFGLPYHAPDWSTIAQQSPVGQIDALHHTLAGSFVHTILEWSAFCTAIFTVILAFSYFVVKQDVTTPIIGVALLCAGTMDAFHTLAADRLITATSDNQNLIPFTWALCRLGNALLTVFGVSLFLWGTPKQWIRSTIKVIVVSLGFGAIAYTAIQLCATTENLPTTIFPHAFITRPWDVIPLVIFVVSGICIYPRFYQKYPSLFSHALIVSTIPNAATQIHMAFGSSALFDHDFNIAHFLKIIAYLVPLTGLILDYIHTHQEFKQINCDLITEVKERQQAEKTLQESEQKEREKSQQLAETLQALQSAQTHLVQSEKMSSLGQLVAGVAHEINNPVNFIHGNLHYADRYVQDLIELLYLYQLAHPNPEIAIQNKSEEIDLEFLQEDLPRLIASMRVGADRIREIVQSLRVFSRLDEAEVKDVDVHEGIDSTLMILKNRLRSKTNYPDIQVIKNYGDLPKIQCYAGQLNQVFMNILSNAIDVLEEQNQTQTENCKTHSSQITISTEVGEIDRIIIRIADNGPGLSPEAQQRLFDPFFTTKPVGKGTGLGLSISYQIVTEKHQGSLRCVSVPGEGAEFIIEIPCKLFVSEPQMSGSIAPKLPTHSNKNSER